MAMVPESNTRERRTLKQFRTDLIAKLPLDDAYFYALLVQADLFPLGSGDMVKKRTTRAEMVSFYLDEVIGRGSEIYLPKLIEVMKECNDLSLNDLAKKMKAMIRSGIIMQNTLYRYV